MSEPNTKAPWLFFAIVSGGCAAFNGAFAKLTTNQLTTAWASQVSSIFGLGERSVIVDYLFRGAFLLMNLMFNGTMWWLFTQALTRSNSAVRVSVINTSANFMITAILGALVFGEQLPGLWWVGAALLVAGSVIIGRREEGAASSESPGVVSKSDVQSPSAEASDRSATSGAQHMDAKAEVKQRSNKSRKKGS